MIINNNKRFIKYTSTNKLNQFNVINNLLLYDLFSCCQNYTSNTKLN